MTDDEKIAELAAGKRHEELSILARRCEAQEDQGSSLSPASIEAIFRALLERNENAPAERWLDRLLPLRPDDVTLLKNKGRLCLLRADWAAAIAFYERAFPQQPADAGMQAALALCRLKLLEFGPAIELYESALALEPDQKYWWVYLAQARLGIGLLDAALGAYRRAFEIEPNPSVKAEIDKIERRLRENAPAGTDKPVAQIAAPRGPASVAPKRYPFDPKQLDLAMYGTSVIPSYREYLQAFIGTGRQSILMRDLAAAPTPRAVYSHRHDVDHSLEFAYMMASIEADCGVVATYYMLHPGDYGSLRNYYGWIDGDVVRHSSRLTYVCKAMRDMGHEIGLHNNFAQLSLQTGVPIAELIRREVEYFDSIGVRVVGSASHGSDFARRNRFTNYEIFRECRRASADFGRTVLAKDMTSDGAAREIALNAISLADAGMAYEAYFLPYSLYLSDTGSRFTMSGAGAASSMTLPSPGGRPVSMEAVAQAVEQAPGAVVSLIHADWWRSMKAGTHHSGWFGRMG